MAQDQLAQAAGVRRASIAQLESGRRRGSTKVLADIAYHDPAAFAGIVEQVKAKLAA